MSSASFDGVPRLNSFAAALHHEANVKPIRGRPDSKPLGDRRKTHATIRRDGEAVICMLAPTSYKLDRFFYSDVLTYHPDGRIVFRLDGWGTQSICAFIGAVAGCSVGIRHNRAWIDGVVAQGLRGCFPLHTYGDNTLRKIDGVLHFDNPATVTLHRVNRAAAKTVRRIYKPFKDYLSGVLKVRDSGFSEQEMGDMFGWRREGMAMRP